MTYYTDGGTKNNGQKGLQRSYIAVVQDGNPHKVLIEQTIGDYTCNEAELIAILTDSQLCIGWLRTWKSKKPHLQALIDRIRALNKPFTIHWVPREVNRAGHVLEGSYGI